MITVEQCGELTGLASHEMVLGATPSAKHRVLLSSYVLESLARSETVRKMIVADIRMSARSWNGGLRCGLLGRVEAVSFRLPGSQTGNKSRASPPVRKIHSDQGG